MKSIRSIAKALGKRGGLARAKRLSAAQKKAIASHGGRARAKSLLATRRVRENFEYLNAVIALQGKPKPIKSVSTYNGPLPGHYAKSR